MTLLILGAVCAAIAYAVWKFMQDDGFSRVDCAHSGYCMMIESMRAAPKSFRCPAV